MDESRKSTFRLQIDTGSRTIVEIWEKVTTKHVATEFSDQVIRYVSQVETEKIVGLLARIDRIAGTISFESIWKGNSRGFSRYACRRATQKF